MESNSNKETNLQKIREATELLLLVPFSVIEDIPFFVSHPIFDIVVIKDIIIYWMQTIIIL